MKRIALWAGLALLALVAFGCYNAPRGTTSSSTGSTSSSSSGSKATSSGATASSTVAGEAKPAGATSATSSSAAAPAGQEVTLAGGLKYVDLKVGDGDIAEAGQMANVHYTGWLTDGTKFDSSVDRGQPFQFRIGAGNVIRGWDEGVKGMRIGGKRHLTIPPDMGYGANGYPPVIPANATLVFDVELLGLAR